MEQQSLPPASLVALTLDPSDVTLLVLTVVPSEQHASLS